MLDNKRKTPKVAALQRSIRQAYAGSADNAAGQVVSRDRALNCVKKQEASVRCQLLAFFWTIYRTTGDEAFFDLTVDTYNHSVEVNAKIFGYSEAKERRIQPRNPAKPVRRRRTSPAARVGAALP